MKDALRQVLDDCTSELDDIRSRMQNLRLDKARDYFTKYALIKASGTIEFVFRSIVADYFESLNSSQINYYLENTVRKGSLSASYDNMANLLKKFDNNWSRCFKQNVQRRDDYQRLRDSSKSLVDNRHLFAHGRQPTATFEDIYGYYLDCLRLVEEFDSVVCNSNADGSA